MLCTFAFKSQVALSRIKQQMHREVGTAACSKSCGTSRTIWSSWNSRWWWEIPVTFSDTAQHRPTASGRAQVQGTGRRSRGRSCFLSTSRPRPPSRIAWASSGHLKTAIFHFSDDRSESRYGRSDLTGVSSHLFWSDSPQKTQETRIVT